MSRFRFVLDGLSFVVTRDDEFLWNGNLKPNLRTYGYAATDSEANSYELNASGFFWWKRQSLFCNSERIDEFRLSRSIGTGVRLDRRQFIVDGEGKYLFSVQNEHTMTENGIALFNWECNEHPYLPQVISFLVMRHQGGGQPYGI